MEIAIYSPVWFFGYDSLSELVSMFITFFIAFYSYRMYRLTQQQKFKSLYFSFLLIGIAFLARSLTNWIIYKEWVTKQLYIGKVIQLYGLYNFGYIVHIFFMLAAYMLLLLLLWDIKNKREISLLFLFVLLATFFAHSKFIAFHGVSFILLCYLSFEFWKNARKTRHLKPYLVFGSFAVLAISQLAFLFINRLPQFYVAGELIQLLGYVVLLFALLAVFKK